MVQNRLQPSRCKQTTKDQIHTKKEKEKTIILHSQRNIQF